MKEDEPKGVGGWLLFFCFALTILGPPRTIENLGRMWDNLKPGSVFPVVRQLAMIETVATLLITVYGIVVGILIWRGSARGRTLARQYLLIRAASSVLLSLLTVMWAYNTFAIRTAKAVAVATVPESALEVGICLIWWTYFTYSKRVRNTYGPVE